jgi:pre-rRNA-processing protein TSR3
VELNEPDRFQIYTYPKDFFKKNIGFPENSLLLHIKGKELDSSMTGPLIILDGTWRYSESMYTMLPSIQQLPTCSLPIGWCTAYPRRQEDCSDPTRGLASIEAIYVACLITKRETKGLLDGYFWKDTFLKVNEELIKKYV